MPDLTTLLYPYQRDDVKWLSRLDAALLASEMGLGKTLEAIAWALERPGPRVIVTPASMKYVWDWEIRRVRPSDKIDIVGSGILPPKNPEWVIINYDILGKHLEALQYPTRTVIFDESHYIKNRKAQRTKAAVKLAEGASRRLLLTGTPLLNRPMELFTQLVVLGKQSMKNWFRFGVRYAGGKQVFISPRVGYVWNFNGASNLDELRGMIKPFTLRRRKEDVLPDLPSLVNSYQIVDLDPEAQREYRLVITDYKKWAKEQGRRPPRVEQLTRLNILRQLAVRGKIPSLMERLELLREEGKKALVFCGFLREGLNKVQEQLGGGWVRITGEENAKQRVEMVRIFQEDPRCLVALCSTMAAGVGITLTAAEVVFFLDLPWSPKIKEQAQARAHRIGQTKNVQVIHLLGKGTIDEVMAKVLQEKARVINLVVDGKEVTDEELSNNVVLEVGQLL